MPAARKIEPGPAVKGSTLKPRARRRASPRSFSRAVAREFASGQSGRRRTSCSSSWVANSPSLRSPASDAWTLGIAACRRRKAA